MLDKKLYMAAELMEQFCSETKCSKCPLREVCYDMDREKSMGQVILNALRNETGV